MLWPLALTAAVYSYELSCLFPYGSTECGTYSSELRVRLGFLPLTRSLATFPCLFREPVAEGEVLVFPVEQCHGPWREAVAVDVPRGRIR